LKLHYSLKQFECSPFHQVNRIYWLIFNGVGVDFMYLAAAKNLHVTFRFVKANIVIFNTCIEVKVFG